MSQPHYEDITPDLQQLSDRWADAELQGNTDFLKQTLAEDFVAVGPRGFLLAKHEWLDRHQSGALTYNSFTWDDVRTRIYGDTAILIGRQSQTGAYQGQDIHGEFRATLIWVRLEDEWRLAGLHLSPIMPAPATPTGR